MNREKLEVDVVTKAHLATHNIRQPSWAAHCMALGMNLDEAEKEVEFLQERPTVRIKTPAYDFRPTPLYTVIPKLDELELEWDVD